MGQECQWDGPLDNFWYVILSEAKDLAKRRILRSEGSCEAKDPSSVNLLRMTQPALSLTNAIC